VNLTDYGMMLVMVGDKVERRPIDYVQMFMDVGPPRYVPVISDDEMVMHTIDGTVHILKVR